MSSLAKPGTRCAVTTVLVCLLTALSFVLAGLALKTFRQRELLRISPVYTELYRAENDRLTGRESRRDMPPMRLVFFGDSRVHQWSPAPNLAQAEAIWRGVLGETTAQMLFRFKEDVVALSPTAVIIQAGINDIVAGSVLGQGRSAAVAAFGNLESMIKVARAAGIRVLLLTVIHPSTPSLLRRAVWSRDIPQLVDSLNASLLTLRSDDVEVLDVNAVLAPDGGPLPGPYAKDTLHLTDSGYVALNGMIESSIEGLTRAVQ
jgi:lysophospholipase L1-like esterase